MPLAAPVTSTSLPEMSVISACYWRWFNARYVSQVRRFSCQLWPQKCGPALVARWTGRIFGGQGRGRLPLALRSAGFAVSALARCAPLRAGRYPQARRFSCQPQATKKRATARTSRTRIFVARAGVEPATLRFSGGCSYQLSYLAVPETGDDHLIAPTLVRQKSDWSTKNPASGSDAGSFQGGDPDRTRTGDLRRDRAAR